MLKVNEKSGLFVIWLVLSLMFKINSLGENSHDENMFFPLTF
jgi:hypothetical protein